MRMRWRSSPSGASRLTGSRSQVVRQYRRLSEVLSRELDEPPLPDTEAIYRKALVQTMLRAQERAAFIEPIHPQSLIAVGG
jgi:DNA-binding SARP family transcriptional activator